MTSDEGVPILREAGSRDSVRALVRDEVSGALVDLHHPLIWRRIIPLAPDFELRQGQAVLGEMEPSLSEELDAVGECLGQTLELRLETGLFQRVRVATVRASREPGPRFIGLFWGWGRIVAPDGETLRWRHSFKGLYRHVLLDSTGTELLHMQPPFLRFARTETRVTLSEAAWERADLAELLLLTWFLRAHAERRGVRIFKKSRRRRRV